MRGILLAAGNATRLNPCTNSLSKHLLPIYDKPMIYYPLTTLMLAGIKECMLIVNERDLNSYQTLFGDGSRLGMHIEYKTQSNANGIAEAFVIAKDFIKGKPCCLILGDNIFFGDDFVNTLKKQATLQNGGGIILSPVSDPQRYGIANLDASGKLVSVEEKPDEPTSNLAITGCYFFDGNVTEVASNVVPSKRGELEITSVIEAYLEKGLMDVQVMGRGFTWLDAGTFDSMLEASEFIQTTQKRHGLLIGCPEEIALNEGWISNEELTGSISHKNNAYNHYLHKLAHR